LRSSIKSAIASSFVLAHPHLLVDVPRIITTRHADLHSVKNLGNITAVVQLVRELLVPGVAQGGDLAIFIPYHGQYLAYLAALERLDEQHPAIDIADITLRKVDSFQGGEQPVMIIDLTITDRPGFVREANRLNETRGRSLRSSGSASQIKGSGTRPPKGTWRQTMSSRGKLGSQLDGSH
jgi:hypothetical protein